MKRLFGLKQINWLIIACIVLINGYIIVAPFVPRVGLWWHIHQASETSGLPYQTKLKNDSSQNNKRAPIPTDNRLIIPKIALNQHIFEGTQAWLVHKGVWARPNTSTPPRGSNTVMVAHRFTYDGPATFYSLDKLAKNDKIVVYWQSKEYDYTVVETKVVPPTAIEVEAPSKNAELTLYTCTPLWSAKDRLVVVANLDTGTTND